MSASVSYQNKADDEGDVYEDIDDQNGVAEAQIYSNLHGTNSFPGNNGAHSNELSTEKVLPLPQVASKRRTSMSYGKKLLAAVVVLYLLWAFSVVGVGVLLWHKSASVNVTWTDWEEWGTCSTTCGVGMRNRVRRCTSSGITPQETACKVFPQEYQTCETKTCAVRDDWADWAEWSACSRSCGLGIQNRLRQCNGTTCVGHSQEYEMCEHGTCAVNGGWSPWGSWNICSKTFGVGLRNRRRQCNNPLPQFGGNFCDDDSIEYEMCEVQIKVSNGIRLNNSVINNIRGRVEVYHDGSWGTVCDDGWDNNDATVVCRMLGHKSGTAYKQAAFGEGSGDILLDDLDCTGYEPYIHLCKHSGWGRENCGHAEDAGVVCF